MTAERLFRWVAQVAENMHNGAVKILVPLVAFAATVAITACSDSEDAAKPTEAPTEEFTEEPTPEPDPGEDACELLINGQDLDGVHVRPIALTSEGGVLGDDWAWGTLLVSLGLDARDSSDTQIGAAASQIADYGTGEVSRQDLYKAGLDMLGACQNAGYVDTGWASIPWPDEATIQEFLVGFLIAGGDSDRVGEDARVFDLGLESCQAIADEHNQTGAIPGSDWILDEIDNIAESGGLGMDEAMSVVISAANNFCPEYKQVVAD